MQNGSAAVQFASQMEFLQAYANSTERKKEHREKLESRLKALEPIIEEHEKIAEDLEELKKSLRDDEKFLISMNDMVLRNTGQPISNGALFEDQN